MTAVDLTPPVGRPVDLNAVMSRPGAVSRPAETPKADRTGFSFGDFIDVINPLQHIPGVAELYRSVTNDQISDDARKAGNVLYGFALGGPVGLGAMMAYNAVGDRLNGADKPQADTGPQLAEAAPVERAREPDIQPLPLRKPEADPVPVPKPARETELLGTSVAASTAHSDAAPSLTGLLSGAGAPDSRVEAVNSEPAGSATAASSVAYVDVQDTAGEELAVVPNDAGLSRLATHQSNRLPLDVLKALQERHAERTSSERS